jgi:hypothetical protein
MFVPAIVMLAFIVFAKRISQDGDPFWHIAAGRWMIDHGTILHQDVFSYTASGTPWIAHEWLSEVVMAATYQAAGWDGIYVLFGLAFAATAFLLARHLLKYLDPVPALFLTLFVLADLKGWIQIRPHVFVLPILVLWTAELLEARSENCAPRWFLFPLMILWVNLHASFLFGAALILPFALEAVLGADRTARFSTAASWGAVFAGSLIAALVNPNGIWGLLFPLTFTASSTELYLIGEWHTITFSSLGAVEISFLAGLFLFLLLGVRMPVIRLLVLVGMLHLALEHQRFVIILAIVGSMILAEPIANALKARGWTKREEPSKVNPLAPGIAAALVALAIAAGGFAFTRSIENDELSPVAALSNVPETIASQPVFNDWIFGGYLIFTGSRPFIDGRAEVYGDPFMRNYLRIMQADKTALDETFAKYKVTWTLLSPDDRTNAILDLVPGWCLLYADKFAVVHVRKDAVGRVDEACRPPVKG